MTQGLQKETADGAVRLNKYISDAGRVFRDGRQTG